MNKNNKKKIISLLAVFILLFSYVSLAISSIDAYAAPKSSSGYSSSKSGSYSSKSSGYSSKPSKSSSKSDSGIFSTKPGSSKNNSSSGSSSSKTDSGSFSTKPSNKNNNNNSSSSSNSSGNGSSSSRPIFGNGRYYGGYYSPFSRMFYSFRMSSWITKLVVLISIIVVLYIIIDFIRSRRD